MAIAAVAGFAVLDTSTKFVSASVPVLMALWVRYMFQAVATTALVLPMRGRSVLRTALLLAGPAGEVLPEHLPDEFLQAARSDTAGPAAAQAAGSLQDQELAAVRAAVQVAGGNISVAARALGVSRNTVYRKLRQEA